MRRKLTLQINTEAPKVFVVEPYTYETKVAKGDVVELTYVPEDVGDTIQITDTHITLWCYEPVLNVNGTLVLDLQVTYDEPATENL